MNPLLTFSIVSHGQSALIRLLLEDLRRLALADLEIIITVNIPEDEAPFLDSPFQTTIIRNTAPKGFGANHNAAFKRSSGQYFVVVNPDIRLPSLDVESFLNPMKSASVGAVAPVVLNSTGQLEDSARPFPTIAGLARRVILRQRSSGYAWNTDPIEIDWAAGMFVAFRREAFAAVEGFDHRRFFMYFEDVDICRRMRQAKWRVLLQPSVHVIHDARRASHRSIRHLSWHITSALRYFTRI